MPSKQVARYNERIAAEREARQAGFKLEAEKLANTSAEDQRKREEDAAAADAALKAEFERLAAGGEPVVTPTEDGVFAEGASTEPTVQDVLDQAFREGILEEPAVADASTTSARIEEQDGERVLVEVIAGDRPEFQTVEEFDAQTGNEPTKDEEAVADTDVVSEPEATAVVITEVLKTRQARKPRSK